MTIFSPLTLAQEWGCSERHVRNLIASGQLAAFRLGGKLLRITPQAVEDFVCRQTAASSDTETVGTSNTAKERSDSAAHSARLTGLPLKLVSERG